jgi:hypothetical protein
LSYKVVRNSPQEVERKYRSIYLSEFRLGVKVKVKVKVES